MIKTLKKVGNGNAIFLDKAILELVGLTLGVAAGTTSKQDVIAFLRQRVSAT